MERGGLLREGIGKPYTFPPPQPSIGPRRGGRTELELGYVHGLHASLTGKPRPKVQFCERTDDTLGSVSPLYTSTRTLSAPWHARVFVFVYECVYVCVVHVCCVCVCVRVWGWGQVAAGGVPNNNSPPPTE